MRLIKMTGGLGNQMFIYALYLRMRKRYPSTRIDLSDMVHYKVHYGYEMRHVFGLPEVEVCWPRWIKKVLEAIAFRIILERHEKGSLRHYDGDVHWPLVYYKGFYQRTAYLNGIEQEIRDTFRFDLSQVNAKSKAMRDTLLADPNAVSLHIRRGDYLEPQYIDNYGNVCQIGYYKRAIQEMNAKVTQPHYFVFSDDIQWVHDNLRLESATYIDWNREQDSWQDMMLMSSCRHHIICNSTFSWWGAWLGQHEDSVILAPSIWSMKSQMPADMYPPEWTKVECDTDSEGNL